MDKCATCCCRLCWLEHTPYHARAHQVESRPRAVAESDQPAHSWCTRLGGDNKTPQSSQCITPERTPGLDANHTAPKHLSFIQIKLCGLHSLALYTQPQNLSCSYKWIPDRGGKPSCGSYLKSISPFFFVRWWRWGSSSFLAPSSSHIPRVLVDSRSPILRSL